MRGVAGARPHSITPSTWLAAAIATVLLLLAGIAALHRTVSPEIRVLPRATTQPEPSQTPNRDKKAARETGHIEARLAPLPPAPKPDASGAGDTALSETGRASRYDLDSETASGEDMDGDRLTATHPTLPLGSHVKVENLDNGPSVVCASTTAGRSPRTASSTCPRRRPNRSA